MAVSVQVLVSLLCARLITPMVAAYFLAPRQHSEKAVGPVMRQYTRRLTWSVRHRWITVGIGLLVFLLPMAAASSRGSGFLPAQDTGRSIMAIALPRGAQVGDTRGGTRRRSNQRSS